MNKQDFNSAAVIDAGRVDGWTREVIDALNNGSSFAMRRSGRAMVFGRRFFDGDGSDRTKVFVIRNGYECLEIEND